ncbi:MAG: DUF3054 domain-containing protein [Haloferacaceae archaeon]
MANAVASFLDRRIDARATPLAVGDVLVVALLLTGGTVHHNGVDFVLSNPAYLAGVLAPFLVGWVVAAPLLGAYAPGATETAKAAVPLALRSWVVADVVGLALRATPLFHGGVELSFAAVTLLVGAVGLTVWRVLFFQLR